MANWLRKIMPQETKFFPLFDRHAAQLEDGAKALKALLVKEDSGGEQLDRAVRDGSGTSRDILDRLRGSFVTPFDRADVKEMTASIQAALLEMDAVARTRASAKLDGAADLARFGDLIVASAGEVRKGVRLLEKVDQHADDLRAMRDKVGETRGEMAKLRDEAMLHLFERGGDDPVATLAGVKFLERVGAVAERLDAVADHIDDLVLDHV